MKKVALAVSILILLFGIFNIKQNIDKYQQEREEENWSTLHKFVASVNIVESQAKEIVERATNEEAIKRFSQGQFNHDSIIRALEDNKVDSVDFIYVANNENDMITVPYFELTSDYKPTDRGWYKMAMASEEVIITDIYIDAFTGGKVMTAAKAMNESSVVSIDYNLKALDDIILTLENVQIFNGDGYYVLEDFTSVPMNIELDDFNGDSFETEYYKYYKASTKISGRALVYGVDKINQEKLLTSSTLQRSVVFLLLSILVYLIIKRVEK